MPEPRKWVPGKADAIWKLMICAREAADTERLLCSLAYYLNGGHQPPGGVGTKAEAAADYIRQFSGDQIVDALLQKHRSAYQSVQMAFDEEN